MKDQQTQDQSRHIYIPPATKAFCCIRLSIDF